MSLEAVSPLPLVDVQEARASELRALGDYTGAHRVLMCGAEGAPWGRRWCRRRDCPACAQAAAARNAARVLEGMRRFRGESTVAVLLTSTVPLSRLAEGIEGFRAALSTLRKRDCFRNVLGGAGGIETKVTANEHMVNLHAHLALDVAGELPEQEIASAWRELTGRGRFSVDPENPEVLSPVRFSKYATKPDTWSPEPGSLSLEALDLLRRGVKGKRLAVSWGTATKPPTPKAVKTGVSTPSEAEKSHGGITPTEESMARQPPHDKTSKPVNSKWIPEGSRHAKPRKKGRRRRGPISDVFVDPDSIDEHGNPKKPTRRSAFEQGIRRAEAFLEFATEAGGPWVPLRTLARSATEWATAAGLPPVTPGALALALRRLNTPSNMVRGRLAYRVKLTTGAP